MTAIEKGGIYIDCDVMPLRPFDELTKLDRPFACRRSSKSFENAVLGSPPHHPATRRLVETYPGHFWSLSNRTAVTTGPQYVSEIWFGRPEIEHLPPKTFYPYNGFMAPKRDQKLEIFKAKAFPECMLAAHFSNHRWGGKPQNAS